MNDFFPDHNMPMVLLVRNMAEMGMYNPYDNPSKGRGVETMVELGDCHYMDIPSLLSIDLGSLELLCTDLESL